MHSNSWLSHIFQTGHTTLSNPFGAFFLLTGIYGAITVIAWMSFLFGGLPLPLGWSAVHWHSHEMLFGLIPAAIAGFLLTAICNWTGASPLQGRGLFGLVIIWCAGRITMWTASWWPNGVVAVIDVLFLLTMAIYVLRLLHRHGNKRNFPIAGILLLLCVANIMMHTGFIKGESDWLMRGELMALGLITLLMIVIGGRIIPLFTTNWLRINGGDPSAVKCIVNVDRAAIIATLLLVVSDFFSNAPWLTGVVALVAGVLNAIRLLGWSGRRAAREPLLWILHLAYSWIVIALLLKSAAGFNLLAPTVWQHALGVGAIGTLILGIMTRVALGHTGRPLSLPKLGVIIFIAITVAAITRVLTALQLLDYRVGLLLAAASWAIAFTTFVLIYWPSLTRPRADNQL